MPIRESTPSGAPVWADLSTTDMAATQQFYTGLFGWTYDGDGTAEEYGGYVTAYLDDRKVAGLYPHMEEFGGTPNVWTVYLKSDDIAATSDAVAAAGGRILTPAMHVAPFGHMAVFRDPGQAAFGGWQPQEHHGFGIDSEHGAPVWHENLSKSYADTVAFYEKAFGWETSVMSDTDEFRYTTLGADDDARAGLMDASGFLPPDAPSQWITYWGLADLDASIARATELGGSVLEAPADTPYGRMATLVDCCGATIKVNGL
ncbi:VOC family protein [Arthrobacter sp. KK5.5]|uniref:VOC family protein n=1 Tax=Arthrobacter sp. KK5.5 TaxID=3373084 RepID=UPI003EE59969